MDDAGQKLEEGLRAIFDQAAVGIVVSELDGRLVQPNRKCAEILGYTIEELRARTFLDITHPDDVDESRHTMQRLLERLVSAHSFEKRYIRKDGSDVWSWTTVTLLRNAAGEPERFIGVIEDISTRKRTEAALQEETRMLELLNYTGQRLASTLDVRDVIDAVMDAGRLLSGAELAVFLEPSEREPTAMALGEPIASRLAVPVRSRSGDVLGTLFFGHAQPLAFSDRVERLVTGIAAQAGVALDNARLYEMARRAADERKVLLERERAARAEAERTSDMKGEFLATLSHELRTPLNAIVGWAQILRNRPYDEAGLLKGLETIERNGRLQARLIEDLLDMSRITTGKLRLDLQPVHPASVIEAAVETARTAADAKGIRLEMKLDTTGPISADPNRLQQVMWNLLSNAIKFTPKGGTVCVGVARANTQIEMSVADTGVGIRPEFMPHLFERFRQGDQTSTRQHGGLGLGLSIVKSLVELHGGAVHADSPGDGLGTTITVTLPVAVPVGEGRDGRIPSSSIDFTSVELAGLTVLVVDDQPDALELIKRVLADCSATVLTATSLQEALAVMAVSRLDVLITDIGMPDGDGYDLLRRVRAMDPQHGGNVPAIALTAFVRSEDRDRAQQAGFFVHVSKPVDPSELVATVASAAGRVGSGGHPV